MSIVVRAALRAAACAAALLLIASPAAASTFDGTWMVRFEGSGACTGAFQDVVTVTGGKIAYGGSLAQEATGTVTPRGIVHGSIVRHYAKFAVAGRLFGRLGRGTWKAAGGSCGGHWSARRA